MRQKRPGSPRLRRSSQCRFQGSGMTTAARQKRNGRLLVMMLLVVVVVMLGRGRPQRVHPLLTVAERPLALPQNFVLGLGGHELEAPGSIGFSSERHRVV